MKTEAEARKCWCPFARIAYTGTGTTAVNRVHDPLATLNGVQCIASECMAWRWVIQPIEGVGFCGLAGKP